MPVVLVYSNCLFRYQIYLHIFSLLESIFPFRLAKRQSLLSSLGFQTLRQWHKRLINLCIFILSLYFHDADFQSLGP